MKRLGGEPELEVGGAGDEGHLARTHDPKADHGDEGVGAALDHRQARR
jgi:hypothetical protein